MNATALFKAIDRPGTDELMLIDVLCTATNEEILAIKAAYDDGKYKYKKFTLQIKSNCPIGAIGEVIVNYNQ